VNVNFDKTIILTARGHRLDYKEIEKRPKQEKESKKAKRLSFYKPPRNHPWRGNFFQALDMESDISKKFKR
jgi:hypothetical protein